MYAIMSRLWKLLAIVILISVYYETPEMPQVFLVESLRQVQAFSLRDLGSPMDEAQVNPHKFRILKVLDYDLRYN